MIQAYMKALYRLLAFGCVSFYLLAPSAIIFAATPPPTCKLQLNTSVITVGGSVTLKWSSTNATDGAITSVGNVGPSGSVNLLPSTAQFTTYVGSFTGPGGTANCSATVQTVYGNGTATQAGSTPAPTAASNAGKSATAVDTSNAVGKSGAPTGLVPCGTGVFSGGNEQGSATGCQACNLAQLIQNIITFAIGLAIPIAAALFAWAGILYFTSAGDHHKIEQAKGIFKNAFVGFLIAITAWLVINTALNVIFSKSTFVGGNWFSIQCSAGASRPNNGSVGDVLTQVLGNAQVTNNVVSTDVTGAVTPIYACGSGSSLQTISDPSTPGSGTFMRCQNADGTVSMPTCNGGYELDQTTGQCVNANTGQAAGTNAIIAPSANTSGGRGVAQCSNDNTNCSISALQALGLSSAQANVMSCIAVTENAGQAVGCSGTGPCGTFQVSQTNWNAYAPPSCSAAAFGSITAAQNNAACNLQVTAKLVQTSGYQPWTCPGCNSYAQTCVNNYGSI